VVWKRSFITVFHTEPGAANQTGQAPVRTRLDLTATPPRRADFQGLSYAVPFCQQNPFLCEGMSGWTGCRMPSCMSALLPALAKRRSMAAAAAC
jgi:hypothetical protein